MVISAAYASTHASMARRLLPLLLLFAPVVLSQPESAPKSTTLNSNGKTSNNAKSACQCDAPFISWPGAGCLHVVSAGAYEPVQVACRSLGGQLATLKTRQEEQAVRQVLRNFRYSQAWVGLYRAAGKGSGAEKVWSWSDGSAVTKANWDRGTPLATDGDCGTLTFFGGWTARHCYNWRAVGICLKPITRPDGSRCKAEPVPLTLQVARLVGAGEIKGHLPRVDGVPAPPPAPPRIRLEPEARPPLLTTVDRNRLPLMDATVLWHQWM